SKGKETGINSEAASYRSSVTRHPSLVTLPELQERMVFLMINEAARCLEEQIVTEPADVDFAMVMGTGFAPFRGGPLRYADKLGAAKLAGAMEHLVDTGAPHFAPCALLKRMAGGSQTFY